LRAEERLRILDELTRIGMNVARSVERRAMAALGAGRRLRPTRRRCHFAPAVSQIRHVHGTPSGLIPPKTLAAASA
jgi:hypothetical protein